MANQPAKKRRKTHGKKIVFEIPMDFVFHRNFMELIEGKKTNCRHHQIRGCGHGFINPYSKKLNRRLSKIHEKIYD